MHWIVYQDQRHMKAFSSKAKGSRETALHAGNEVFYNKTAVVELLASAAHSEKWNLRT